MTVSRSTTAVWTSLVSVSRGLIEAVEEALKAAGFPSLSWYDALLEIERAGEAGIRPLELQDRLLLPQYATSRLLDKIEKAGLIARISCEDDRRGHIVRITAEGAATRQQMWPVYAEVLVTRVQRRLTEKEATELSRLLAKLRAPGS